MNSNISKIIFCFILIILLAACTSKSSPVDNKPTPCIPQTVEVTRIVQKTPEPSDAGVIIPTQTSTTVPITTTVQLTSTEVQISPDYFDGFIVLSKYFTLLDHNIRDEAISLHSTSFLNKFGSDPLVPDIKSIKVRFIYPYNYWLALQNLPPITMSNNEIRYIVGVLTVHNAPALNPGGTPTPHSETIFVTLIKENGEWKINGVSTSP